MTKTTAQEQFEQRHNRGCDKAEKLGKQLDDLWCAYGNQYLGVALEAMITAAKADSSGGPDPDDLDRVQIIVRLAKMCWGEPTTWIEYQRTLTKLEANEMSNAKD